MRCKSNVPSTVVEPPTIRLSIRPTPAPTAANQTRLATNRVTLLVRPCVKHASFDEALPLLLSSVRSIFVHDPVRNDEPTAAKVAEIHLPRLNDLHHATQVHHALAQSIAELSLFVEIGLSFVLGEGLE